MTKAEADDLLNSVLETLWKKHRRPILGSRLKAAMVEQARKRAAEFDERVLGYKGFAEYLQDTPAVTVTARPGSDLVVTPGPEKAGARGTQALWIRPDVWRAFVSFPKDGEYRAYDSKSDT